MVLMLRKNGRGPRENFELSMRSLLPSPSLRTKVRVLSPCTCRARFIVVYMYTLLLRSGQCGASLCGYDSCDIFILPGPEGTHSGNRGWAGQAKTRHRDVYCSLCSRHGVPECLGQVAGGSERERAKRGTRSKKC